MNKKTKERIQSIMRFGIITIIILTIMVLINVLFGEQLSSIKTALATVLLPGAIALFVSYMVRPIYNKFLSKGMSEKWASLLTVFIFILILLVLIAGVVYLMVYNVMSLADTFFKPMNLQETLKDLGAFGDKIWKYLSTNDIIIDNKYNWEKIASLVTSGFDQTKVMGILSSTLSTVISIVMMPVFLFFFLKDGSKVSEAFISFVPEKWFKKDVEKAMELANVSTTGYMKGKLLSILVLFGFFAISFSTIFVITLGIKGIWTAILFGVIFAMIISILDLVPYIGPAIGVILPILFLLVVSSGIHMFLIMGAILILVNFFAQGAQKMIVEPLVMSIEVDIHPLLVFAGLLFFGSLFGFIGLIIATPLIATIQSLVFYYRDDFKIEEGN